MQPDVVVLAPDRPEAALIVEVKASAQAAEGTQEQLKEYMFMRKCPVALLVTPEKTIILKDTYQDSTAASVQVAGEIPTGVLLGRQAPQSEQELESAIFEWLEHAAASWVSALPSDPDAARTIVEHIVPAVAEGRVTVGRAA